MEFLDFLKQRRSYRKYTGEPVEKELLDKIVEAGLLAPSGRNIKPEELIVVTDSKLLTQLSQCRKAGSQMLEGAGACIIVLGDEDKTDVWVEDCSNVILTMHYMASSLGLGSCWIQGRNRISSTEESTEDYIRNMVDFPKNLRLEALLSIGHIDQTLPSKEVTEELLNKVQVFILFERFVIIENDISAIFYYFRI